MNWILVFCGGGFGSLLRYGIGQWIYNDARTGFPYPTFIANVASCFIAGILMGYFAKYNDHTEGKMLLLTGFCGGFSTFSTFSAESLALIQKQAISSALLYIFSSIILGLLAVYIGYTLITK